MRDRGRFIEALALLLRRRGPLSKRQIKSALGVRSPSMQNLAGELLAMVDRGLLSLHCRDGLPIDGESIWVPVYEVAEPANEKPAGACASPAGGSTSGDPRTKHCGNHAQSIVSD